MNQPDRPAGQGSASQARQPEGIWRCLVRLAPSGQLLWAGSVHTVAARRGDAVVVATATGHWSAEVLSVVPPAEGDAVPASGAPAPSPIATGPPAATGPLAGEVLRIVDADDRDAFHIAAALALRLRDAAARWLGQQAMIDRAAVLLLSAEVSLDHRVGVIGVLGPTDPRFGRAAAELADALQLQRVQWVTVGPRDKTSGDPAHSAAQDVAQVRHDAVTMTPEQAADELFWERFQAALQDGNSLGKGLRVAAGNRGMYQQKTRGQVPAGRRLPPGRSWMIRVRTAAGGIAPGQLEQLIQIADQFGDGSLRLTTRQAIQLHGVVTAAAPDVMQRLHQAALFTAGSCGNAVRNLTCCPLPPCTPIDRVVRRAAVQLAADLLPRGPAFEFRLGDADEPRDLPPQDLPAWPPHDVVADEARVLPHKWKVGVTDSGHNCIDVLTNDFAVVISGGSAGHDAAVALADLYVGGSTAYQPQRCESFARLASWLGRVPVADVTAVAKAALAVFRQSAIDAPRHLQRWKYTVQRLGIEAVAAAIQQAGGGAFALQRDTEPPPTIAAVQTHGGHWRQPDGRLTLARAIPGGRLHATGDAAVALRQVVALAGTIRVGPRHTLVLSDVRPGDQGAVTSLLDQLAGAADAAAAVVACPALPTCPLAVAAAETECQLWIEAMRPVAAAAGVPLPDFALSGCANGCSHPLTTAIGVVAVTPRQWTVYLGGNGQRMGAAVASVDGRNQFAALLGEWLRRFAAQRRDAEGFSDWFWRHRAG